MKFYFEPRSKRLINDWFDLHIYWHNRIGFQFIILRKGFDIGFIIKDPTITTPEEKNNESFN